MRKYGMLPVVCGVVLLMAGCGISSATDTEAKASPIQFHNEPFTSATIKGSTLIIHRMHEFSWPPGQYIISNADLRVNIHSVKVEIQKDLATSCRDAATGQEFAPCVLLDADGRYAQLYGPSSLQIRRMTIKVPDEALRSVWQQALDEARRKSVIPVIE